MIDVVIVGGGVSGLTTAWKLRQAGLDIILLERQETTGGNIKTLSESGYRLETGPHSFMGSSEYVWRLSNEIAITEQIEEAQAIAANRYIFRDGRLSPLPTNLSAFIRTPLLSYKSKLRLMAEPFIPNGAKDTDTAWDFFCRRFGQEAATYIMSPFVSGIYAGNVKLLGAKAAFPKFWNFERESGSMIIGAFHYLRKKKKRLAQEGLQTRKGLFSFLGGLGKLSETLTMKLNETIITSSEVKITVRDNQGYHVESENWQGSARSLILAIPPPQTATLLGRLAGDAQKPLRAIPMAPVALVHWGLPHPLPLVPDGFGLLVPRLYDLRVLGTLFPSQLFQQRAPNGYQSLASFYGGMHDPLAADLADHELLNLVHAEHETLFGGALPDLAMTRILRY